MPKSFDRVADIYDETRKYPDDIMRTILEALDHVLDKEDLILDAGVGTGRFARPLQLMGYRVVGVDLSPRMLSKAAAKGTEGLVRGDILALPFKDAAFGTALSVHVMHLISDWELAVAEVARVTSGNFLSVAFAKEESPAEDLRNLYDRACAEGGYEPRHPGMREREITGIIAPDIMKPIAIHEHMVDAQELIEEYQQRDFSDQWDIPQEVHDQAMAVLRERYEGVDEVLGIERISLIGWESRRLRETMEERLRASGV